MGVIGLVMMSAPALGPATSGLIIELLSWNWILWLILPFLIFALLYGLVFVQNVTVLTKPKIDVPSIFLSTIGFGGIVYGFSVAGHQGWGSAIVIGTLILGLTSLLLFSSRQLKLDTPMLDLRVLKYPIYTLGLLSVAVTFRSYDWCHFGDDAFTSSCFKCVTPKAISRRHGFDKYFTASFGLHWHRSCHHYYVGCAKQLLENRYRPIGTICS